MFEKILSTKKKAKAAKTSDSSTLQDITDDKCYRQLLEDGQFLAKENYISGLFNTDGIPLYKSTHVKLWPIFLAINETLLNTAFFKGEHVIGWDLAG